MKYVIIRLSINLVMFNCLATSVSSQMSSKNPATTLQSSDKAIITEITTLVNDYLSTSKYLTSKIKNDTTLSSINRLVTKSIVPRLAELYNDLQDALTLSNQRDMSKSIHKNPYQQMKYFMLVLEQLEKSLESLLIRYQTLKTERAQQKYGNAQRKISLPLESDEEYFALKTHVALPFKTCKQLADNASTSCLTKLLDHMTL